MRQSDPCGDAGERPCLSQRVIKLTRCQLLGVLYLGPAGSTPTIDCGAVRSGAELAFSRERLEIHQGSPRQLIKQYVVAETVRLTVRGLESTRAHCTVRYS